MSVSTPRPTSTPTPTLLPTATVKAQPRLIPRFDHVVIVIEENKSYQDIIGSPDTPYINSRLAAQGASFTNAHGEWHPSQPNYVALFSGLTPQMLSGLTQRVVNGDVTSVTGDQCIQPRSIQRPNLASELGAHQFSFRGYAEDMPSDAASQCYTPEKDKDKDPNKDAPWVEKSPWVGKSDNDTYVSKHIPWLDFADVPASVSLPWTEFPQDYTRLPTISFVIPNDQNNMHPAKGNWPEDKVNWSKFLRDADTWLGKNLDGYIQWAKTHNSLFILTWDEDSSPQVCDKGKEKSALCQSEYPSGVEPYPDKQHNGTLPRYNIIPTVFEGAGVKAGAYGQCITHYDILHTLEVMYGLPLMGETKVPTGAIQEACGRSASEPITDVWGNSGN